MGIGKITLGSLATILAATPMQAQKVHVGEIQPVERGASVPVAYTIDCGSSTVASYRIQVSKAGTDTTVVRMRPQNVSSQNTSKLEEDGRAQYPFPLNPGKYSFQLEATCASGQTAKYSRTFIVR
jgi:hypothetical protein